ncbi:MAG: phage protein NinX family protein [Roseateles sp.]|uniref:phage protein NinX family protein n=1 Tax=Roseateles sp. TaxID=1971397 RepID=UPI00403641B2
MTKHKVSELTGTLLDAAVAHSNGWPYRLRDGSCEVVASVPLYSDPPPSFGESGGEMDVFVSFCPSTRWSQGGPLIERERITLHVAAGRTIAYVGAEFMSDEVTSYVASGDGETPLIAAMRAFVTAKLGEEVELPA